jgi:malate dehydrogenase
MKNKITVVGAGNVGAQCAYRLAQKELGEIVLIDILEGIPQGKALDMSQAAAIDNFSSPIIGTYDYSASADSKVVVVTAGLARKPGMSRDDLIIKNAAIVSAVIENVVKYAHDCILLMVTNPLDVITYHALKVSGFPKNRVLGMAPLLDSARMSYFISRILNVSIKEVYSEVLGSHGDLMVPIPRLSKVSGKPITELLSAEQIDHIVQKTKDGGAEIVSLLKSGSAYYAPGSAAARMVESIIRDKKDIIGTCCYLSGEFELSNLCLGVPARIGKNGIEEIIEIELTEEERAALHASAKAVAKMLPVLGHK